MEIAAGHWPIFNHFANFANQNSLMLCIEGDRAKPSVSIIVLSMLSIKGDRPKPSCQYNSTEHAQY